MWSAFTYHEPSTRALIVLSAWLYLLNVFGWIAQRIISARLLGQIFIGIIFGTPLAGWLDQSWQEAFVTVGYVGLLLIVFEGGLSSSFTNVLALLPLSLCVAITGILAPIGLSFILSPLASFVPLHAFAAGAALSSTSLGTTLSVLHPSAIGFDLRQTRLGTTLLSAAIIDDVIAFVLASILEGIGDGVQATSKIGETIGRTVGVTVGLGVAAVIATRYALRPSYVRLNSWTRWRNASWGGEPLLVLMMAALFIVMIAAAGYAGTSPLYGAYIAGLACAYLSDLKETSVPATDGLPVELTTSPSLFHPLVRHHTYPQVTSSSTMSLQTPSHLVVEPAQPAPPLLRNTFHHYLTPLLDYLLMPIFFGSIGYSIPFVPLWTGRIIWRGVIYALLMTLGKMLCGMWILVWPTKGKMSHSWRAAMFLGSAMVARGEIGLLISQIAYNTPEPLLAEDGFLIVNWGIILCTVIGPVGVGWMVRRWNQKIVTGGWK